MEIFETTSVFLGIITLFYLFIKWRHQYWARKGVPQLQPQFFFGDFYPVLRASISMHEFFRDVYLQAKQKGLKYIGLYNFLGLNLVPVDLDFIKQIMTKDFMYFGSRGLYLHEKEPLTMHLLSTEGEKWRNLRVRITPTFTSGKMKMMYETLVAKGEVLNEVCGEFARNGGELPVKETVACFTTDVIGNVAFGIEPGSLRNPNSRMREIGRKVIKPKIIKYVLESLIPNEYLGNYGYRRHTPEITNYFTEIVMDTIKYRRENNIERNDFMQLMLNLKKYGTVSDDEIKTDQKQRTGKKFSITDQEIVTEAFLFFGAGFETSSSATTFTLIELAHNQDIQDKLRREIIETLERNGGKIPYDELMNMPYLDMVFKESLRIHPVVSIIPRKCTKDYKIPGTNIVIEKNTYVPISAFGIHHDPEYYPDPEKFNPENFTAENQAKRPDFSYLPFGEGPRMCIGLRFGVMQSKYAIVSILKNFRVLPHKSIEFPLKFEKGSLVLAVQGENRLRIEALRS